MSVQVIALYSRPDTSLCPELEEAIEEKKGRQCPDFKLLPRFGVLKCDIRQKFSQKLIFQTYLPKQYGVSQPILSCIGIPNRQFSCYPGILHWQIHTDGRQPFSGNIESGRRSLWKNPWGLFCLIQCIRSQSHRSIVLGIFPIVFFALSDLQYLMTIAGPGLIRQPYETMVH